MAYTVLSLIHRECLKPDVRLKFVSDVVELTYSNNDEFNSSLSIFKEFPELDFDPIENDTIGVPLRQPRLNCFIYFDYENFITKYPIRYCSHDFNPLQPVAILLFENNIFYYNPETEEYNTSSELKINIIKNYSYYLLLIEKLIANNTFTDFHEPHDRIIITISSHKTVPLIRIGYNRTTNLLMETVDQTDYVKDLLSRLEDKKFALFFKDVIFEYILSVEEPVRMAYIFNNLKIILESTVNSFSLYASNFSFQKIIGEFNNEKQRYIELNRDIVNKIQSYITAFPIAFSASFYASFQLMDSKVMLIFIGLAYLLYTILSCVNLCNLLKDLTNLKLDIDNDLKSIKSDSEPVYDKIQPEMDFIFQKISNSKTIGTILFWIVITFLITFLVFIVLVVCGLQVSDVQNELRPQLVKNYIPGQFE